MYLDKNRKNVNGSQKEKPIIAKNNEIINVGGYQKFTINAEVLTTSSSKITKQLNILKTINIDDSRTIIDIGCSNGYFGFWYLLNFPETPSKFTCLALFSRRSFTSQKLHVFENFILKPPPRNWLKPPEIVILNTRNLGPILEWIVKLWVRTPPPKNRKNGGKPPILLDF